LQVSSPAWSGCCFRLETTSRSYFPWFSGGGPNPQFFGARSQVSAVDADWPLFEKGDTFKYELNCHQIQLGANAGPFFIDRRMTHDQWVLIMICAWVASLFAAILLFVPS
jgi:hypothetical protein